MIRTILLATTAVLALSISVYAADMAVKAQPAYAPAFSWTGFYLGANVGYGSATLDPGLINTTDRLKGVFGGGQIGYNWQTNAIVLGVEADIQASDQKQDSSLFGGLLTTSQKSRWFGTVRGRIGYAPGPWMIYATGGFAYAKYDATLTVLGVGFPGSTTANGWTAGGGVEWIFMPKWSVKAEYLYMDFGNETVSLGGVPFTSKLTNNLGRVGINYHF
jgi:outer membrane immunogenic protein